MSLKKSIFISLLGHLTLLSIFSFSFGDKIPPADYAGVSFWGAILPGSDLISRGNFKPADIKEIFMRQPDIALPKNTARDYPLISGYHLKPLATLSSGLDKAIFIPKTPLLLPPLNRSVQPIMFYPLLPYQFLLYFKDRQVAHIELMFKISSSAETNSIALKRKISSGNLEADLLAMRYINHYLFVQQAGFPINDWQKVEIDLSPKNDKR